MSQDAVDFVRTHNRAVLITRRKDGGLQASPIRVQVDADGAIVAASRGTTAKVHNLRRDDRFALCVVDNDWHGKWLTIEGRAELHALPEALEGLRSFYRMRDGEVDEGEEFASRMRAEQRVLVRLAVDRAGGTGATT